MSNRIVKQINAWFPVILWAAIIFKFSSGTVPLASQIYWQDFAVKKTGHILLFGALAILIYRAFLMNGISKKEAAFYSVILALFYGVTDEFHQMYTQGREARIRDIVIDGFGASLVIWIIYNFLSKLPNKIQSFLLKLDFK